MFKSSCVLCSSSVSGPISLCTPCQNDLPSIIDSCDKCGLPTDSSDISICGNCIKTNPSVDYTLSLYHYQSPVDYLIGQLKFKQQLSYAAILGHLLSNSLEKQQYKENLPDVILPVPLHAKRLIKRGFNQSLEIAKPASKALGIPIDYNFVRRIKNTSAQTELNAKQRKRNIKDCFHIKTPPSYKHVVLVDDVVTTGATTNELARLLKQSGVEEVGVWSIARAELF